MSTITTINSTDLISDSRAVINTNFSNLNTDKIETSYLDTDTALAANSDVKIATQKAVKTYIDTSGGANASTTVRGIVEEATQAEVDAQTAAGGTGARLFINPSTTPFKASTTAMGAVEQATPAELNAGTTPGGTGAATFINPVDLPGKHLVGALGNTIAKTYFNVQLLFTLWIGSSDGSLTTDFDNWIRTGAEIVVPPLGAMIQVAGTGATSFYITSPFFLSGSANIDFTSTNIIVMDFWAKLPATSTGDVFMGFANDNGYFDGAYNSSTESRVGFHMRGSTGVIYATIAKNAVGVTNTDVSSGVTNTNWNNFRIELDLSNNALFYINGTLVATLSGANLPSTGSILIGLGRSDTAVFAMTAPNFSIQMNP